jgi:predicted nucleotidyltransferase
MLISKKDISIINDFLIKHLSPYAVYIFGSAIKDTTRIDSDIDIAFLSESPSNACNNFILAQTLAAQLKRDVDLIDLKQATTVLQMQIIANSYIILSKDEKKRAFFEMLVYKNYAKLNEERAPVLYRIKESKSIYAK